jgi:Ca2+:H+ antiporter
MTAGILPRSIAALKREWPLAANLVTTALFLAFGKQWLADLSSPAWFAFVFAWLFAVILASAFAVVHHAEAIAEKVGEPAGTLVLTLCVTGIEVMMISAVMLAGKGNAALARDAMFAVIMIVLNGMLGVSLLLGGLRHREQDYNLMGANAFLAVIVPLAVLCLVLPSFTVATPGPVFSPYQAIFFGVMSFGLYGVFLAIQNVRHKEYFVAPRRRGGAGKGAGAHAGRNVAPLASHIALLVVYLVPLVILSKQIAVPIEHGISVFHAPAALGGFLVAVLILSPESLAATRAALANELQRSVNVLLGSVLATIGLTVPSVLAVGYLTGQTIVLGLDAVDTVLLLLTLAVSVLTFSSARTNVLLGAVHSLLFLAYLMLMFER